MVTKERSWMPIKYRISSDRTWKEATAETTAAFETKAHGGNEIFKLESSIKG